LFIPCIITKVRCICSLLLFSHLTFKTTKSMRQNLLMGNGTLRILSLMAIVLN
jgi:hypothetical protein